MRGLQGGSVAVFYEGQAIKDRCGAAFNCHKRELTTERLALCHRRDAPTGHARDVRISPAIFDKRANFNPIAHVDSQIVELV